MYNLGEFTKRRKFLKVTQAELAAALGWRKELVVQLESGNPPASEEQLRMMTEAVDRVYRDRAEAVAVA